MKNYEKIIDDNSLDNSFKIIEKYNCDDKRIKIIRNKKNRGALYSRSIGVLNSKSKYVIPLDSDDSFINDNLFNICYEEVKNNNLDILEFSGFQIKKPILRLNNILPRIPEYLRYKTNNITLKQPQLFNFLFQKNRRKIIRRVDGYLWGKCIKTNTYIQSLNILGKNIYSQFHNFGEDRIVNFVLFKYAKSFKFIEEYGIAYLYNPFSVCNSYAKESITHDELINIMSIYNFTKNSINLNIVVYEFKHRWKKIIKPGLNEDNKNIIKYIRYSIIIIFISNF
jgi:glycosyltransferase involved in cell wall biosynthesis